ncbi:hypothetical protein SAMN05444365_103291 [Micromonospora pattaloongensis]|uniref:4-amino-4-deoxy-L-arabinose transferase n=1 Tax=Micromonospora pattaloongensis TaxID=405436 RepID=A0A1H3M9N3_9ACTN|nr:hypothetical protein [Micromonospora pattaloongensis]SDY73432.1 hypothetical protein SAMN05444365_103291 [Micromonospora pattaloongensis]
MSSTAPAAQDAEPDMATTNSDPDAVPSRAGRALAALRPYAPDLGICLLFVLLAGWVTHGLWPDPNTRVLALNPEDQTLYEWFLAADSRVLFGDFALLTDRLNAPDGVNMMANTTVIALGALFSPVSVLLGAPVTFAVIAGGNLALSAIAWYLLYSRTLGAHRLAAALGGGFCGFAPGMVSQSNSHLHMTALWLVPVMVWLIVRMLRAADPLRRPDAPGRDRRRLVTSGVGLALTVSAQVFIGEEVLFLTALTLVVMTIGYAVARPSYARRVLPGFVAGMLIAVAVAVAVLAYPLWFQFAGPQSVPNGVFSPHYFSADLASWGTVSPLSVAGAPESARLSTGPAEYNTFLGWPLLLVAIAAVAWLGRRPLVVACTLAAVAMAALSAGPRMVIDGHRTDIPGPYALLVGLPVVDGALPMRFALALIPIVATILVLAVDEARRASWQPARLLVPAAVLAALAPIVPAPLPTADRPPLPEFISAGHWRSCVRPGGVLVPVPLPTPKDPWPMRWAAAADAEFRLPEGFFIGPYAPQGKASMGTYKQPTSLLLNDVGTGGTRTVGDFERQQAQQDIAFWDASCFVLADGTPYGDNLRATLDSLFGPGVRVADAWTWKVR